MVLILLVADWISELIPSQFAVWNLNFFLKASLVMCGTVSKSATTMEWSEIPGIWMLVEFFQKGGFCGEYKVKNGRKSGWLIVNLGQVGF